MNWHEFTSLPESEIWNIVQIFSDRADDGVGPDSEDMSQRQMIQKVLKTIKIMGKPLDISVLNFPNPVDRKEEDPNQENVGLTATDKNFWWSLGAAMAASGYTQQEVEEFILIPENGFAEFNRTAFDENSRNRYKGAIATQVANGFIEELHGN